MEIWLNNFSLDDYVEEECELIIRDLFTGCTWESQTGRESTVGRVIFILIPPVTMTWC